jgi:hypothetical protein
MNKVPALWSKPWIAMWFIGIPTLAALAFHTPFWLWVVLALLMFGLPEYLSLKWQYDKYPPLTHTIRHFLPNWVAFPLIYFGIGIVGAHWFGFDNEFGLGGLMALLGWLQDHFALTYTADDPYPFRSRRQSFYGTASEPKVDPPRLG